MQTVQFFPLTFKFFNIFFLNFHHAYCKQNFDGEILVFKEFHHHFAPLDVEMLKINVHKHLSIANISQTHYIDLRSGFGRKYDRFLNSFYSVDFYHRKSGFFFFFTSICNRKILLNIKYCAGEPYKYLIFIIIISNIFMYIRNTKQSEWNNLSNVIFKALHLLLHWFVINSSIVNISNLCNCNIQDVFLRIKQNNGSFICTISQITKAVFF